MTVRQVWLAGPLLGGDVQGARDARMGNARDVFAELDGVVTVIRADEEPD